MTLAADDHWTIRRRVAENPKAPKQALLTLAADDHWIVAETVAKRRRRPRRVKHVLAAYPHRAVSSSVSGWYRSRNAAERHDNEVQRRRKLDEEYATHLHSIHAARVDEARRRVGEAGDDCPAELWEKAASRVWYVREETAEHPDATPPLLELLASDDHWMVAQAVRQRPGPLPAEVVAALARHPHPAVHRGLRPAPTTGRRPDSGSRHRRHRTRQHVPHAIDDCIL